MTRLARFVQSPAGRLYARSCETYGVDPARLFSDPIVALNARVGFFAAGLGATQSDAEPTVAVQGGRVLASGFDPLRASDG